MTIVYFNTLLFIKGIDISSITLSTITLIVIESTVRNIFYNWIRRICRSYSLALTLIKNMPILALATACTTIFRVINITIFDLFYYCFASLKTIKKIMLLAFSTFASNTYF